MFSHAQMAVEESCKSFWFALKIICRSQTYKQKEKIGSGMYV